MFLASILPNVFLSKNKLVAVETCSNIAVPLFSLYVLSQVLFSEEKRLLALAKIICLFSAIVALGGILDIWLGKNILYEHFIKNQYYDRYVAKAALVRPISTQFNPAPLGTYLLACIPFGFVLIGERRKILRITGLLSIILNTLVLILTFSRAAFVGLFVSLLFFLWYKRKKLTILLLLLAFFLTVALSSFLKPGRGFDRFGVRGIIFGQNYTSPLSNYRLARMEMVFKMLKDSPLFGIGLNHIRTRFFEYYPGGKDVGYEWRIADNMYLTLLAETGLIGFFSFLVFIFYLFRNGLRKFNELKDGIKREILLVGLSALLGVLVNMAGYELFYWHIPFLLFCFLCGLVASQSC